MDTQFSHLQPISSDDPSDRGMKSALFIATQDNRRLRTALARIKDQAGPRQKAEPMVITFIRSEVESALLPHCYARARPIKWSWWFWITLAASLIVLSILGWIGMRMAGTP